jgi:hypothetical protein
MGMGLGMAVKIKPPVNPHPPTANPPFGGLIQTADLRAGL